MGTDEIPDPDWLHNWVVVATVAVGALLLGFAVGWILRGDGGEATTLEAAAATQVAPAEANRAPTGTAREPKPAEAPTARPRSEVGVAVLNGSGQSGVAGQTAGQLQDAGYSIATADNGPATPGPSVVYFIAGRRPEAARLRKDLQLSAPVQALPDGPVRDIAPESAELVVLLGSG